MKGLNFIINDRNEKTAIQIDLKILIKHREELENILDIIVAEHRKDNEDISWSVAKEKLKKEGKL